jgi:Domain of unknown function (DUF5655)
MLMQLDELEEVLERELFKLPAENQPKPMWTCPDCGHQFVIPSTYHSCGIYNIDDHFAGKEVVVRQIFEELTAAVEQFGPVTVYAQKTRIVLQARMRFVAIMPRKRWLTGQLWIRRQAEHPRIYRIEMFTFRDYGHMFRLLKPEDINESFMELLHEAYALGSG